jgi:hypothetical protein
MINFHNFDNPSLANYLFSTSTVCGYDKQGNPWYEEELIEIRLQGLIVQEFIAKSVFFENALLGYIQECPDRTWLSHSAYNEPIRDIEVFGFINEFYAVVYLHQMIKTVYPDAIGEHPRLFS